jgi:hypothetical protein
MTPEGVALANSVLPCLNSNNSDRVKLSTGAKKTAYLLSSIILRLVSTYGIEKLGFLTLTFPDAVTPKEASRRFNNLNRRVLSERYVHWMAVYERGGTSGLIHFHLVIVLHQDIRTGFDFEAIARKDYRSASKYLKAEWAYWRSITNHNGKCPHHAYAEFGRYELLPIKSTGEGISKYVGKYLEKHMQARRQDDKGVRLLRMSQAIRNGSVNFAWVSPRASLWRAKVRTWAKSYGITEYDDLAKFFGSRWAYNYREAIFATVVPYDELSVSARAAQDIHLRPVLDHFAKSFGYTTEQALQIVTARTSVPGDAEMEWDVDDTPRPDQPY